MGELVKPGTLPGERGHERFYPREERREGDVTQFEQLSPGSQKAIDAFRAYLRTQQDWDVREFSGSFVMRTKQAQQVVCTVRLRGERIVSAPSPTHVSAHLSDHFVGFASAFEPDLTKVAEAVIFAHTKNWWLKQVSPSKWEVE